MIVTIALQIFMALTGLSSAILLASSDSMTCAQAFENLQESVFMDIHQLDENNTSSDSMSVSSSAEPVGLESLRLGPGRVVTYRYTAAQAGQPTVVLLNGLIYALSNWQEYHDAMVEKGYGVLVVGYSTQPESIAALDVDEKPFYAFENSESLEPQKASTNFEEFFPLRFLETEDLVQEVLAVAGHVSLSRFHVVSLSYSSMVGQALAQQHSDSVESVIFMAPAVRPANRYHLYGESRHQFYFWQKKLNMNPFYDSDYFYDLELLASMYPIIYSQFSLDKSINVSFNDFFAGVFQKARSVKWFDLKDFAKQDVPTPVHLFIAEHEDPPLLADQELFWDLMSENQNAGVRLLFEGSRHALPSDQPRLAAQWTQRVIEGEVEGRHRVGTTAKTD